MAADNLLTPSTPEAGIIVPEGQEQKGPLARIGTGVRMATFALALGVGNTQAQQTTEPVQGPILLAQANIETDGKIYIVYVIQQDGSLKEIKYTKKPNGRIIPPETNDGKLLDGSPATDNPKLNTGKNISILSKYDKDTQTYASIDIKMVVNEADVYIKKVISLAQDGKDISKNDLFNAFYGIFIYQKLGTNQEKQLSGLNVIATKRMNLNEEDLSAIRKRAEEKAKAIIPVVIKAVG